MAKKKPEPKREYYEVKLTLREIFFILKSISRYKIGTRKYFLEKNWVVKTLWQTLEKYMTDEKWREYQADWRKLLAKGDELGKPKPKKQIPKIDESKIRVWRADEDT